MNGYVVLMQEYNKLLSSQKIEQLQLTNVEPTQDTPKMNIFNMISLSKKINIQKVLQYVNNGIILIVGT